MKRILTWGLCIALVYILMMGREVPNIKIPGNLAKEYVKIGTTYQIPWTYLAAIDEVEHRYQKSSRKNIEKKSKTNSGSSKVD